MIKEKRVLIKLTANIVSHYENIGYEIPKRLDKKGRVSLPRGAEIEIDIEDLMKGSSVILTRVCEHCTKEDTLSYSNILKARHNNNGIDMCRSCIGKNNQLKKRHNIEYEKSLAYNYPEIARNYTQLRIWI